MTDGSSCERQVAAETSPVIIADDSIHCFLYHIFLNYSYDAFDLLRLFKDSLAVLGWQCTEGRMPD